MLAIQSFLIGRLCGAGRAPEVAGIHALPLWEEIRPGGYPGERADEGEKQVTYE